MLKTKGSLALAATANEMGAETRGTESEQSIGGGLGNSLHHGAAKDARICGIGIEACDRESVLDDESVSKTEVRGYTERTRGRKHTELIDHRGVASIRIESLDESNGRVIRTKEIERIKVPLERHGISDKRVVLD